MDSNFINHIYLTHQKAEKYIAPSVVRLWLWKLIGTIFPGFYDVTINSKEDLSSKLNQLELELKNILSCNDGNSKEKAEELSNHFFSSLPKLYELLLKDIEAIYIGDPAAKTHTEIIHSYPGFYAIAAYRVAHYLHKNGVALIPRIISENAHSHTGIDIHPGAQIGEYFCIDHGTGVVIGETSIVGNHVKIYQGVTLGALSVGHRDETTEKRHPTIQDHVVIYAGATILGGNTVVGSHSIIGGGVWVTKSVPSNSKIYYKAKMSNEDGSEDTIVFKS